MLPADGQQHQAAPRLRVRHVRERGAQRARGQEAPPRGEEQDGRVQVRAAEGDDPGVGARQAGPADLGDAVGGGGGRRAAGAAAAAFQPGHVGRRRAGLLGPLRVPVLPLLSPRSGAAAAAAGPAQSAARPAAESAAAGAAARSAAAGAAAGSAGGPAAGSGADGGDAGADDARQLCGVSEPGGAADAAESADPAVGRRRPVPDHQH